MLLPHHEKQMLKNLYRLIPMISPNVARYQLELLTILAKDIMSDHKNVLEKKKAFYDEQRTISERIQEIKENVALSNNNGQGLSDLSGKRFVISNYQR